MLKVLSLRYQPYGDKSNAWFDSGRKISLFKTPFFELDGFFKKKKWWTIVRSIAHSLSCVNITISAGESFHQETDLRHLEKTVIRSLPFNILHGCLHPA
jgi:hypothetical protein